MTQQGAIMTERAFNFNAGPSILPEEVLEQAQKEFLDQGGHGMSVMEMSHRDKMYTAILERAEKGLVRTLGIPDTHQVLFLGGGASLQFYMVPLNLAQKGKPVDMIHTGTWTKKAIDELKKSFELNLAYTGESNKFTKIPKAGEIKFNPSASYVHLCSNNTIEGTQWTSFPNTNGVPLVADMSSDILSKPVDVSKFDLIFAGAQKNLGPAGVTVVIIRKSWAEKGNANLPVILDYRTHLKEPSLYNTPPTFPIYMVALVAEWIEKLGGAKAMEKKNQEKAKVLYDAIDKTGYYSCPVSKEDRSLMNVVFRIKGGNDQLEEKFVKESKAAGFVGLAGHRSVGGLRASIYNAQPLDGVKALVQFMQEFEKNNG